MAGRDEIVAVKAGGKIIELWTEYDIDIAMTTPSDDFSLTLAPCTRDAYELCRPDEEVQILLDGTPVITGYIEERDVEISKEGSSIRVGGGDKIRRLLAESAPLTARLKNYTLERLAERVIDPWFEKVGFSNARNRQLVRGGARVGSAKARTEPIFGSAKHVPKKVEPGEVRWEVLEIYLREAGLLAWSSGDGTELIIAAPNFDQEPQYRFFCPAAGSLRAAEGNCTVRVTDTIADVFSQVQVVGSARGDGENYGSNVMRISGVAKDGPGADGIGKRFRRPKRLILPTDELSSGSHANELALAELNKRASKAHRIIVQTHGHSQQRTNGSVAALFAADTIAELEVEQIGLKARYLVEGVRFRHSKSQGRTTELSLLPVGVTLAL